MSAICWSDGTKRIRLSGAERALMGNLINNLFVAIMNPSGFGARERLQRLFPPSHYLHRTPDDRWAESAATALSVSMDLSLLLPDGREVDAWETALNTAQALGAEPLRLMARLHGQCEIHADVEGPNRKWLAGVIRHGLASGVMRQGMGWDDVIALLEATDIGPVVTDYSVCDSFPNPDVAGWEGDSEAFYDLPSVDQWDTAVAGLRKRNEVSGLEMRPDKLDAPFGAGQTAFTVLAALDNATAKG